MVYKSFMQHKKRLWHLEMFPVLYTEFSISYTLMLSKKWRQLPCKMQWPSPSSLSDYPDNLFKPCYLDKPRTKYTVHSNELQFYGELFSFIKLLFKYSHLKKHKQKHTSCADILMWVQRVLNTCMNIYILRSLHVGL